jgi:hypothetical protein
MRAILSVAAAMAFVFAQAGVVEAGHGHGHAGHGYHHSHGHRFSGGYYYSGRYHNHWSSAVYDSYSNQTLYLDPDLNTYYYWHAGDGRYYPTSYRPGHK